MASAPTSVKLELVGIAKAFDGRDVLLPTDVSIASGEFVAIVGPSGCGKSTLFNIVAGLVEPDQGSVRIDGVDVTTERGHVGYMLQKDLLLPWASVLENVLLGARIQGAISDDQRASAVAALARHGLGAFVHHYPHALSGGMKQRAAMIRTLLFSSEILLLDEPFGALDDQTKLLMQEWLLTVCDEIGATVLFITHSIDEALLLSDRVLIMSSLPGQMTDVVDVPFSRPRGYETMITEEFRVRKEQVLSSIYEESLRAAEQEGRVQ